MHAAIPAIEISNNADAAGAWGPHGKMDARYSVHSFNVCAQLFVGVVVAALAHQIEIKLRKQIRERIRIVMFKSFAIFSAVSQTITGRRRSVLTEVGKGNFE